MKSLIFFLLGLATGIIVMWYGPENIQQQATQAATRVEHEYHASKYDRCVSDFFKENNCLRTNPDNCNQLLTEACGEEPQQVAAEKEEEQ